MARQNTTPKHSPRQPIIVKPEQALPITPFGLEMKVRTYSSSSMALMSSPSAAKPRRSDPAPLSSSRATWCTASRTWDTTARMLDWSLPGGQDHYFKAISELAAGGGSAPALPTLDDVAGAQRKQRLPCVVACSPHAVDVCALV